MDVKLIQVSRRGNREIPVDDENFIIGRESDCELQLDQGRISRRHCRILKRGGRVFVQALYSTAGTAVNQHIIEPDGLPFEVHDGDHLWVGSEHFRFAISLAGNARPGQADPQPAPPPVERGEAEMPTNPLLTTNKKSLARAAHQDPGGDHQPGREGRGPCAGGRSRPLPREPRPSRRHPIERGLHGPAPPEDDRRRERHPHHHRRAGRTDRLGPELHRAELRERRAALEPGHGRGGPGLSSLQGQGRHAEDLQGPPAGGQDPLHDEDRPAHRGLRG